jgi:hypothetical protein
VSLEGLRLEAPEAGSCFFQKKWRVVIWNGDDIQTIALRCLYSTPKPMRMLASAAAQSQHDIPSSTTPSPPPSNLELTQIKTLFRTKREELDRRPYA